MDGGLEALQNHLIFSDYNDEHTLISRYAQQLKSFQELSNPLQEKQNLVSQLEAKNREMQLEIIRLQHQQQQQQQQHQQQQQKEKFNSQIYQQQQQQQKNNVDENLLQQIKMLRQHQGDLERRMKGLQGSRSGLIQQLEELMKTLNTQNSVHPTMCSPNPSLKNNIIVESSFPFYPDNNLADGPSMMPFKHHLMMQEMLKNPPIMPPFISQKIPVSHILRQLQHQQYATMPIQLQNEPNPSFKTPQPQTLPSKLINQPPVNNLNPMNYSFGSHFHQAFNHQKPNAYGTVLHNNLLNATDDLANVMTTLVDEMNMELNIKVAQYESKMDHNDMPRETHLFVPDPSPYYDPNTTTSSHNSTNNDRSFRISQKPNGAKVPTTEATLGSRDDKDEMKEVENNTSSNEGEDRHENYDLS